MGEFSEEIMKQLLAGESDVLERPVARTQRAPRFVDHFTAPILLERAAYLRKLAKLGDGSASETLKEYPGHCTMLSVRLRSGVAELHEEFADLFFILDGRATLVTGGTIAHGKRTAAGEVRGSSIEGGSRQELRAGDVAHVAAGTPHQMLLAADKTLSCLVVKIRETE